MIDEMTHSCEDNLCLITVPRSIVSHAAKGVHIDFKYLSSAVKKKASSILNAETVVVNACPNEDFSLTFFLRPVSEAVG